MLRPSPRRQAAIEQKRQHAEATESKSRADRELAQRPPPPPSLTVTGRTTKSVTIRWGLQPQDAWARGGRYTYTVLRADGDLDSGLIMTVSHACLSSESACTAMHTPLACSGCRASLMLIGAGVMQCNLML